MISHQQPEAGHYHLPDVGQGFISTDERNDCRADAIVFLLSQGKHHHQHHSICRISTFVDFRSWSESLPRGTRKGSS